MESDIFNFNARLFRVNSNNTTNNIQREEGQIREVEGTIIRDIGNGIIDVFR
jgi:hypothetical protein